MQQRALLATSGAALRWYLRHRSLHLASRAHSSGVVTSTSRRLDFTSARELFAGKSSAELLRSIAVFSLCQQEWLVRSAPHLLALAERSRVLRALSDAVLRRTFFAHFCAGADREQCADVARRLLACGGGNLRLILDHSTEEQCNASSWELQTRDKCELLRATASGELFPRGRTGFLAMKVTALCSPQLMERVTALLGPQTLESTARWNPLLDAIRSQREQMTDDQRAQLVSFYQQFSREDSRPLSAAEEQELEQAYGRLYRVCEAAQSVDVSLLIDAEQAHRQPAIDLMAVNLMRRYNRERPLVYNTYQHYLRRTPSNLRRDLSLAQRDGFSLGVKCVRGAYIHFEKQRAREMQTGDPIHNDKEHTDQAYNASIAYLLEHLQHCALVVATHNRQSVELACARMTELQIARSCPRVAMAQLQGMCDHLTYGLGLAGYNAHKLLPFGRIQEVIPFLVRRLQENQDMLAGTKHDRSIQWNELLRRIASAVSSNKDYALNLKQ